MSQIIELGPDGRGPHIRTYGSEIEYGLHAESGISTLTLSSIYHDESLDELEQEFARIDAESGVHRTGGLVVPFYNLWEENKAEIYAELGVDAAKYTYDFLSNGARVYIDIFRILEYATPECLTPHDVVKYQIAGDEFVLRAMKWLRDNDKVDLFELNKRSTDEQRDAWGHHENLSTRLRSLNRDHIKFLGAFSAMKSVLVGSGGFVQNQDKDMQYVTSPRLWMSNVYDSVDRHRNKPIVNTALSSDTDAYRMQLVSNEASNSPWAIRMSHGLNSIAIRLLEHGIDLSTLNMHDHNDVYFAKEVAEDINLANTYETIFGKHLTALNWLELFSEIARSSFSEEGFYTEDEIWTLDQLDSVVDAMKTDGVFENRVEWAMRKIIIDRKQSSRDHELEGKKLWRMDFYMDNLLYGLLPQLVRDGRWGWHGFEAPFDSQAIDQAMLNPPENTRAKIRGRLISDPQLDVIVKGWGEVVRFTETEYGELEEELFLNPAQKTLRK